MWICDFFDTDVRVLYDELQFVISALFKNFTSGQEETINMNLFYTVAEKLSPPSGLEVYRGSKAGQTNKNN